MKVVLIAIHVFVSITLILIVLLQRGKGSDMGAAFGGSSQTVFGSTGAATFLHRVTAATAIIFMLTSLGLAFLFGKGPSSSIMRGVSQPSAPTAPMTQQPAPVGGQEK